MIKNIFWDFDGVLIDSNSIRDYGFEVALKNYPKDEVAQLLAFHQKNGGLSRYVKFRYFFEEIRGEKITDEKILEWAQLFSNIVVNKLIDPNLLIQETIEYIKAHYQLLNMHIVSGSDENELIHICNSLNIHSFFKSINGSPTPKAELIKKQIIETNYNPNDCVLVGDSINDYEAAIHNSISFIAYNNPELSKFSNATLNFVNIHK